MHLAEEPRAVGLPGTGLSPHLGHEAIATARYQPPDRDGGSRLSLAGGTFKPYMAVVTLPPIRGSWRSCIWPRRYWAQRGKVGRMSPVRLLLIDDHLMITEALASWLSAVPDIWVAGRCAVADPCLLDIVRGARPDVITIEVEPLGPAIGEVLQQLVAAQPEAHVVVLSSDRAVAHAVEAARAGVSAWVAKDQDAAELESVIRGVMQGKSWFPPEMLGETLRQLRGDVCRAKEHNDLLGLLTSREREVLLRMMEGKRGRQIAQDLMISPYTVRTHIGNIFAKLDVHSRLEAVRMARSTGLVPSDQPG